MILDIAWIGNALADMTCTKHLALGHKFDRRNRGDGLDKCFRGTK